MSSAIYFTQQAEEDLTRLDKTIAQNIVNKIDWLSHNTENIALMPLKDKFKGKYKLRIGDWRVIYSFNRADQTIIVYAVRHRSDVYKT